jgi:hypothetical protein
MRQLADQIGFGKVFRIHTRHVDLLGDPCEAGWPGTGLMLRLVPPDWGSNAGGNTAAGHIAVLDARSGICLTVIVTAIRSGPGRHSGCTGEFLAHVRDLAALL